MSDQGSLIYNQQQSRYWSSQQAETQPVCRVSPSNAVEVAVTLLVTTFLQCPFAVKSGGHAAFEGASNIQGGVTIDLVNLKQVQVSADQSLTHVGAGNRWLDVYSKLDLQHLSVVGGRVADIGVGGLTLGGESEFVLSYTWERMRARSLASTLSREPFPFVLLNLSCYFRFRDFISGSSYYRSDTWDGLPVKDWSPLLNRSILIPYTQ